MKTDLNNPKNWINPKTKERYRYFDRDGNGYSDVLDWARKFETAKDYKRVAEDTVFFGRFWISTVWLGLDHTFSDTAPPLIFESMVFPKGKLSDLDMNRYTTEDEAIAGHRELVKKWSNPFYIFWHFVYHEGIEDWYYDIKYKLKRIRKDI